MEFDEEQGSILAMKSLEGEVVQLKKPVPISNDVEVGVYLCMCVVNCFCVRGERGGLFLYYIQQTIFFRRSFFLYSPCPNVEGIKDVRWPRRSFEIEH